MTDQTYDENDVRMKVADPRLAILLRRAQDAMPYAAGLRIGAYDAPMMYGDLLGWLDALSARLREAGDLARAHESELMQLRADRAALRRIFGTDATAQDPDGTQS